MSIHRSRGRAGVLALAAIVSVPVALAFAWPAAASGPGPAAAAPCKVVRVGKAGSTANLQAAITAAPAKATLVVTGTCVGSFTIAKDLTIKKGAKPAILKGNGGRVLEVTGATVLLSGLRITGGLATDCNGLVGLACGGGISNEGTLKLVGVTVAGNTVDGGATNQAFGGGVVNTPGATLRIVGSTLSGNKATGDQSAYGGALHNEDGTVVISRSRISGNRADAPSSFGGAIYHGGGTMTISETTIASNVAAGTGNVEAGGIEADGALVIRRSLIASNTADKSNSIGGGITLNAGSALTLTDSTIVGNRAGRGGGIDVGTAGPVSVLGSTIVRNTATFDEGGGIDGDQGGMTMRSTIIARNAAPVSPDCAMSTASQSLGHNLVGNNKDCNAFVNGVNDDLVGTDASPLDPKLGKLLANGGPTKTVALLKGSPAINKGGSAPCATPKDQRGVKRPQLGKCDIGAYEKR